MIPRLITHRPGAERIYAIGVFTATIFKADGEGFAFELKIGDENKGYGWSAGGWKQALNDAQLLVSVLSASPAQSESPPK